MSTPSHITVSAHSHLQFALPAFLALLSACRLRLYLVRPVHQHELLFLLACSLSFLCVSAERLLWNYVSQKASFPTATTYQFGRLSSPGNAAVKCVCSTLG